MSKQITIQATDAPPRTTRSLYPEPFATRMEKRVKHPLSDLFGIKNFGVNLTEIFPGGESALLLMRKNGEPCHE